MKEIKILNNQNMFDNKDIIQTLYKDGECVVHSENGKYLTLSMNEWYHCPIDEIQNKIEESKSLGCKIFRMAEI